MRYSALSRSGNVMLPEGMVDVRGWEVRTTGNEQLGTVKDLVLGGDNQPQFLEVETGGFFSAKRVLLPLRVAQVDEREDGIWVSGISKEEFKSWPEYTGDAASITDDYAARVRGAQSGASGEAYASITQRFYEPRSQAVAGGEREARVTRSEEELAIGKRAVEAGEVGVRKTVETERVRESVPVTREEVTVERRPIEAGAAAADVELREDTIRVPITEEEVTVEKRVVPKEELVIKKEAVQEERVVEDTVRKEHIDVDEQGRRSRSPGSRSRQRRDDEERTR